MAEQPKYFDIRSDFWKEVFAAGEQYEDYLRTSPEDKAKNWDDMAGRIPALTTEQRDRVTGLNRVLKIIAVSGVWCGDCVRQGPMIQQIAEACGADLRWLDRDANTDLRDEVRIVGAMRVPMVIFLTEDFHEIGRFGDRLLSVYLRKLEKELGAACPVPYAAPPEGELAAEQAEWIDIFERMLIMARLSPPLRERHGD